MAQDIGSPRVARGLVDIERGTVNRKIFADPEIYRQEIERVFARCWLYLGHESQIPRAGDYLNVFMGEEPVLVCRDGDDSIHAFINSCRHRGNKVCRADAGNAKSFQCPYHGWTYNVRGDLIGVPGHSDLYNNELDRSKWGLPRVAQVDTYRGMIFGTFDAEAPSLGEYLGDVRWGLDLLFEQGDFEVVPGIARWSMDVNWKFASDNAIGDMYHGFWTHRSAVLAGHGSGNGLTGIANLTPSHSNGFTMVTEYGHGFNANYLDPAQAERMPALHAWRASPTLSARFGELRMKVNRANMLIFPNLFVNTGSREFMLRNPLGPAKMEIWKTTLVDKSASPDERRRAVRASNRHFGPAGMFEQDDGENWDQSTLAARGAVSQRYDLNYAMGLGHGEVVDDRGSPPRIDSLTNEHAQLWMYRVWAEFMDADSWPSLRADHDKPQGTV
jgi:phenylpropionate dioxygenase-like ring-hydroxylating dioxygenase large terminal subunit